MTRTSNWKDDWKPKPCPACGKHHTLDEACGGFPRPGRRFVKLAATSLLTLLIVAGSALPAVEIMGKLKVEQHRIVRLEAAGDIADAAFIWDVDREDLADVEEEGKRLRFTGPPGVYRVKLRVVRIKDGKTTIETARVTITIVAAGPQPVPPTPTPPEPGPAPKPPEPTPTPAPIPEAGFRVLIVYETAEVGKLPAGQQSVLYGKTVRDYLNAKCVTGKDGKTREWRIWDRDIDTANETPLWQAAMKRERKSVPWIVISDGKTGYEGPLPATVAETLTLLEKYGGK